MTRIVEDILGKDTIEEARGLLSVAYTGQEFFEFEQQRLVAQTWTCVGFAQEVPEPGDAMPVILAVCR